MKSLMLILASIATASAYGQGIIDFRNGTSQLADPPDRRVRFVDGTPVVGTQFVAQLFFASDAVSAGATAAVVEPPSPFRATALPGYWDGGTRTLVGVLPGESRDYVVRYWDSTVGDYAANVGSGSCYGQSSPFSYTPPTDPLAPPSAYFMNNFTGIAPLTPSPFPTVCVPEPSTLALMVSGALGALIAASIPRARRIPR